MVIIIIFIASVVMIPIGGLKAKQKTKKTKCGAEPDVRPPGAASPSGKSI